MGLGWMVGGVKGRIDTRKGGGRGRSFPWGLFDTSMQSTCHHV